MWYVIVGLIWVALAAGIFWAYKKKRAKLEAGRARQFDALLSELKRNPTPATGAATGAAKPAVPAAAACAPIPEFSKKQRLLPQAETLLYYVFRAGLPDHEVFAGLTLADLIEIDPTVRGYEREQKARRLAQQRLDLVICTKQLEVTAAILFGQAAASDAARAGDARYTEACLQTAGIRLVRIDPAAPPRHQQVRDLVYGAAG